MKYIYTLIIVLSMSMSVLAGGFKDAKSVDLTKASPEATLIKFLDALLNKNVEAYKSMCTASLVEYDKDLKILYEPMCVIMDKCDKGRKFEYRIREVEGKEGEYVAAFKLGLKGDDFLVKRSSFIIVKVGERFLVKQLG